MNRTLSEHVVRSIIADLDCGMNCTEIGKKYGVSHQTVNSIDRGLCWKELVRESVERVPDSEDELNALIAERLSAVPSWWEAETRIAMPERESGIAMFIRKYRRRRVA